MKRIIFSMMIFGLTIGLIGGEKALAGEKTSKFLGSFKNLKSKAKGKLSSLDAERKELHEQKKQAAYERKLAKENYVSPFDGTFTSKVKMKEHMKTLNSISKDLNSAKSLTDSAKTSKLLKDEVAFKTLTAELSIYLNMCINFVDFYRNGIDLLKTSKSEDDSIYAKAMDSFQKAHDIMIFEEDLRKIITLKQQMIKKFENIEVSNSSELSIKTLKLAENLKKIQVGGDLVNTFEALNKEIIDPNFSEINEEILNNVRNAGEFLDKFEAIVREYSEDLVVKKVSEKNLKANNETTNVDTDSDVETFVDTETVM